MTGASTTDHDADHDADPLGTALWLLVALAGHHRCAGWTFEAHEGVLRCACGVPLYELRTIDHPLTGST